MFSEKSFFERDAEMSDLSLQRMLHSGYPFAFFIHMVWLGFGVALAFVPGFWMAIIAAILIGWFLALAWRAIDVARRRRDSRQLNHNEQRSRQGSVQANAFAPPFSFERPTSWQQPTTSKQSKNQTLVLENPSRTGWVTITPGPIGIKNQNKETRAQAISDFLRHGLLPEQQSHIDPPAREIVEIRTDLPLAGETNVVRAKYVNNQGQHAGFVSLFHGGFEYPIQWAADAQSLAEVEGVVESFRFEGQQR